VSQCVTRTTTECRERSSSAVGRIVFIELWPGRILSRPGIQKPVGLQL